MDDFVLRDDSTAGSRSPLEGSLLMHLTGNVHSDRTSTGLLALTIEHDILVWPELPHSVTISNILNGIKTAKTNIPRNPKGRFFFGWVQFSVAISKCLKLGTSKEEKLT